MTEPQSDSSAPRHTSGGASTPQPRWTDTIGAAARAARRQRPGATGEMCDNDSRPCADETLCYSEERGGGDTCHALGQMGETCSASCPGSRCSGGCTAGLTCLGTTCGAPLANGATCEFHEDCASTTCTAESCVSAPAMGDACLVGSEATCPAGTLCRPNADFEDHCLAPGAVGRASADSMERLRYPSDVFWRAVLALGLGASIWACAEPPSSSDGGSSGSIGTCETPIEVGPVARGTSQTLELGPARWRLLQNGWGVSLLVETPDEEENAALVVSATARDEPTELPWISHDVCVEGPEPVSPLPNTDLTTTVSWPMSTRFTRLEIHPSDRRTTIDVVFTHVPATAPTLDAAEVLVDDRGVEVIARGSDAEGDLVGVRVVPLDAADAPVALDDRSFRPRVLLLHEVPPSGPFEVRAFAALDAPVGIARSAWVTVDDATGARSLRVRAPLRYAVRTGRGTACGLDDARACARELRCVDGVCEGDAGDASCAAAARQEIDVSEVGSPVTVQLTATNPGGLILGCGGPALAITHLGLPPGAHDLFLSSSDVRVALAIRGTCADPSRELFCTVDLFDAELLGVDGPEVALLAEWQASVDTEPASVSVEVRLRPVRESGSRCDPSGRIDRCRSLPCDVSTEICP